MKGKKGFSFAQVVLLAVIFALIFAWCAGAQEVPPAKAPEKPAAQTPPPAEKAAPAKPANQPWPPSFTKQYDLFVSLLGEVRKLNAAAEYLQERVNTLQRELAAQIPPGYMPDENRREFVPTGESRPTPPVGVSNPTMVVPVPPKNDKPIPPTKVPEKKP